MLTRDELHRLALIRQLFRAGVRQGEGPWPVAAFSILSFHDAVEWFLRLAADHLGVQVSERIGFMEYWDEVARQKEVHLTQKGRMERLNGARREMKHRTNLPDRSQISGHREAAEAFLTENTQLVFDVSLMDISTVTLVEHEGTRNDLALAEQALAEGNYRQAAVHAAIAFDRLQHRMRVPRLHGFYSHELDSVDRQFATAVLRQFAEVHAVMELLLQGIDYREYVRFMSTAPSVAGSWSGEYQVRWTQGRGEHVGAADAEFMIDFVVRTALAHSPLEEATSDGERGETGVDRDEERTGEAKKG
jgi:hypothetical protein